MTVQPDTAAAIRRRLRQPPNGRDSTELEIVSEALQRQARIDATPRREKKVFPTINTISRDVKIYSTRGEPAITEPRKRRRTVIIHATNTEPEILEIILRPKIRDIAIAVSEFYGVSLLDIVSQRRAQITMRPRHVLMHLARSMTLRCLMDIGKLIGGRDHSTVVSGIGAIGRKLKKDRELVDEIAEIERRIGAELMIEPISHYPRNPRKPQAGCAQVADTASSC